MLEERFKNTKVSYRSLSTTKKTTKKIFNNLRVSKRISDYRISDIRTGAAGTVKIIKAFGGLWSMVNNHIEKKNSKNRKLNKFESQLVKGLERAKSKSMEGYSQLGESLQFNKDVHKKTPRKFADRVFEDYTQKPRKVENPAVNIGFIQKLAKTAFTRQQGLQSRPEKEINRA